MSELMTLGDLAEGKRTDDFAGAKASGGGKEYIAELSAVRKLADEFPETSLIYKTAKEIFDLADDIVNLMSVVSFKLDKSEMKQVKNEYIIESLEEVKTDLSKLWAKINAFNAKVLEFERLSVEENLQPNKAKIEGWLTELQLDLNKANLLMHKHAGNGDPKHDAKVAELQNTYWAFRDGLENFLISANKAFNKNIIIPTFVDITPKNLKTE
jgi:hypothetical protein